ncbi:P22 phage major capsid protein family protein [Selenomonas ruminantium]|uniref:P22 phage major capsid protein family protein n=1 Tax=Selenomonas ruminantium TaxID=971 RepID=UPI00040C2EA7|nr:phage capsid protein [Selenomonas ruminantium]
MAISTFVPQIWEARLLEHLDKALVYGNLVNRDYEGDIRNQGDTVKINQIGDITVNNYTKGSNITYESVDGTPTTLTIDQAKYFAFKVEDIDQVQANVNLVDGAMARASYALRDVVDKHIAAHYTDVTNTIGDDTTPESITSANKAYEALVDLRTALDEKNVQSTGRFVVVPPAFYAYMLKDSRFVAAGTSKTDSVLANGFIGQAAGFDIYQSNNVPNTEGTLYKVMAGTRQGISYAQQILSTEALRLEGTFSDAVRGQLVYGSVTVQPNALAVLTCNLR